MLSASIISSTYARACVRVTMDIAPAKISLSQNLVTKPRQVLILLRVAPTVAAAFLPSSQFLRGTSRRV